MSEENINPEVQEEQAAIQPENTQEAPQEASFADKSLSELSDVFKNLMDSADRMLRSKEAESIKSAFYKLLGKLRSEAGEVEDSFADVEENFKSLYADYKRERADQLGKEFFCSHFFSFPFPGAGDSCSHVNIITCISLYVNLKGVEKRRRRTMMHV